MPRCHRELRCDNGGYSSIAPLEDFEEIVTGVGAERLEAEVIENQEIYATEEFQQTPMPSVAALVSYFLRLRHRHIARSVFE